MRRGVVGLLMLVGQAAFAVDGAPVQPKVASMVALTVHVTGLRNETGRVQFSLYNQDGSIPDEHFERCLVQKHGQIVDGGASVVFAGLAPGNYAVSVLHDEDEDGVIDRGFLLPTEGVGFSNYRRIGPFNRPNFSRASIQVDQDHSASVSIIYF